MVGIKRRGWLSKFGRTWAERRQNIRRQESIHRLRMAVIDALEMRTMLSVYTVTQPYGTGSFDWAISQANAETGDSTIQFSTSIVAGGLITASSDGLALNKPVGTLTINGPGANLLTVCPAVANGAFVIDAGTHAVISGLAFSGGPVDAEADTPADYGGGIINSAGADLTLSYCTVMDHREDQYNTGCIDNQGTLHLADSIVSGNTLYADSSLNNEAGATAYITNSTLSGSKGAGITNIGTMTVTGSTIDDNTSSGISDSGTLTITNSTISGNSFNGLEVTGTVTVTGTTISNNLGNDDGGGIFEGRGGDLTISDSTISGNSAAPYGGPGIDSSGGGVFAAPYASLAIMDSTITGNAAGNGGGIFVPYYSNLTLSDCIISGNTASQTGGGIICGASQATISNSQINDNSAAIGGGIAVSDQMDLTVQDTTITGNTATQSGGGIYNSSIAAAGNAAFSIANTAVTGNSAADGSDALDNQGTLTLEGTSVNSDILSATSNTGTIIFDQDTDLSGITLTGGTYEITSGTTATLYGPLTVNAALIIASGSTLSVSYGGSLDDQGTVSFSSATLNLAGGDFTVESAASLNFSSDSTYSAGDGVMHMNGSLSIDGGAIITQVTGSSSLINGALY